MRDAYNAFADSFNATRRVIADHNARGGPQLQPPPAPREAMALMRDVLARLVASASRLDARGTRTTGT